MIYLIGRQLEPRTLLSALWSARESINDSRVNYVTRRAVAVIVLGTRLNSHGATRRDAERKSFVTRTNS